MVLVVKDSVGTMRPGTQVAPGCILALLGGSHHLELFGRKPGTNDPVRTRLRYYLVSSRLQSGFQISPESREETFAVNKNTALQNLLQSRSANICSTADETCPGPLTEKTICSQEIKLLNDEILI